ncbi:MAG: type II toxin-antitoxin system death-on-curing family toxin [Thermoanaerobaculia bacterium]
MSPVFLTLDEVLAIHADQLRRYGGRDGLRSVSLLESAIGMPEASFADQFLHPTVPEMAAAYGWHIARNHPFIDGNKRAALASMLVFLWFNGLWVEADEDALTELMLGVASGKVSKSELAIFLERHARER